MLLSPIQSATIPLLILLAASCAKPPVAGAKPAQLATIDAMPADAERSCPEQVATMRDRFAIALGDLPVVETAIGIDVSPQRDGARASIAFTDPTSDVGSLVESPTYDLDALVPIAIDHVARLGHPQVQFTVLAVEPVDLSTILPLIDKLAAISDVMLASTIEVSEDELIGLSTAPSWARAVFRELHERPDSASVVEAMKRARGGCGHAEDIVNRMSHASPADASRTLASATSDYVAACNCSDVDVGALTMFTAWMISQPGPKRGWVKYDPAIVARLSPRPTTYEALAAALVRASAH